MVGGRDLGLLLRLLLRLPTHGSVDPASSLQVRATQWINCSSAHRGSTVGRLTEGPNRPITTPRFIPRQRHSAKISTNFISWHKRSHPHHPGRGPNSWSLLLFHPCSCGATSFEMPLQQSLSSLCFVSPAIHHTTAPSSCISCLAKSWTRYSIGHWHRLTNRNIVCRLPGVYD